MRIQMTHPDSLLSLLLRLMLAEDAAAALSQVISIKLLKWWEVRTFKKVRQCPAGLAGVSANPRQE